MDLLTNALGLTQELVRVASLSPDTTDCQEILIKRLEAVGFKVERIICEEVRNFWASVGEKGPLLCFSGHTDVVPTGPESSWKHPPFDATVDGEELYGRGTEDMKANIAAMVVAVENFIAANGKPKNFRIGFLIAGDEEHDHAHGTEDVLSWIGDQNITIDYGINGEPTSEKEVGDFIKIGRRGSMQGRIVVRGVQGHSAHPHRADNAIHKALQPLADVAKIKFDDGDEFFENTLIQVTNIRAGVGASNVIPGEVEARLNCRFTPHISAQEVKARVEAVFKDAAVKAEIEWLVTAEPFLTKPAFLSDLVCSALKEELGAETTLTCAGGTSDARYIAKFGADIIELGLRNRTLHKVNESIFIDDLEQLTRAYRAILKRLAMSQAG